MRGLLAAVIVMGVLIVAGVGVVGTTIVRRMGSAASAPASVALDEPAGTRMVAGGAAADRWSVVLQGGGPDRMVVLDPRTGAVIARVALAR